MGRMVLVAILACIVAAGAHSTELEELWRVDDLPHARAALFDGNRNVVFVSGDTSEPEAAKGRGFIARVGFRGHMLEREWVKGLNAPKGMSILDDRLYVADTDELVALDLATGEVVQRWKVPGATALSDVYAAQRSGRIFVSDPPSDSVWVLRGAKLEPFARSPELLGPAGLRVNQSRLVVASAGHPAEQRAGRLTAISVEDAKVWPLDEAGLTGDLLGLQAIGDLGWYVSDPTADMIYRVDTSGLVEDRMQVSGGPADLAYLDRLGLLLVPLSRANALVAYRADRLAEDEN